MMIKSLGPGSACTVRGCSLRSAAVCRRGDEGRLHGPQRSSLLSTCSSTTTAPTRTWGWTLSCSSSATTTSPSTGCRSVSENRSSGSVGRTASQLWRTLARTGSASTRSCGGRRSSTPRCADCRFEACRFFKTVPLRCSGCSGSRSTAATACEPTTQSYLHRAMYDYATYAYRDLHTDST